MTQAVEEITPPPERFVRKPYSMDELVESIGEAAASARLAADRNEIVAASLGGLEAAASSVQA